MLITGFQAEVQSITKPYTTNKGPESMVDEEDKHEMAREKITDVTRVTRWRVPKAKCTRRYGATPCKLLKNPELVLTPSTIFRWERDNVDTKNGNFEGEKMGRWMKT
jgi:hypothetical protein